MVVFWYELKKLLEQERERLFLWVPVVFALGIAVFFALSFEPSIWLSLVVIETMIVLAYFWRYNMNKLWVLGWLAIFVLGFVNIQVRAYHLNKIPLLQTDETLYLKGYVDKTGYNYKGKQYIILDDMKNFDDEKIVGKYKITPLYMKQRIDVGECVEMVANMRPLMMPNMVGTYQFNRKQFFEGIKATGYTDVSINKIDCSSIGVSPSFWLPKIDKIRAKIVNRIYKVLPASTAGIATAVIAGEQGKIEKLQTQRYRDSGLAHFLSISGLHMGMIAGFMFLIVRWSLACIPTIALKYDTKKIAAVLAIIMSFIYLIISGWQIATQRAFIMTALVLVGVLVGRKAISMRMIAWAALIILILEPYVLISAGFQMSFAAVIMLVAFYEKYALKMQTWWQVTRYDSKLWRGLRLIIVYLVGVVVADFVASMATLPFAIYHFNRISIYTSIANLLAGPIIALWIMPGVLLTLLLMPLGLEKYVLYFTGEGISVVNHITTWVSGLNNASYQVLSMPSWGMVLIVVGGLWLALWNTKWRHFGWVLIVAGYVSIMTVQKPDVLIDNKAKTFAVKANDGQMIILPNRGNYFTKQMWLEKLAQAQLSKKDMKIVTNIYKGKKVDKKWVDLVCDKNKCIYKNEIELSKNGGLLVDGKDYSKQGALSIYKSENETKIITVRHMLGDRYWNRI